MPQTKFFHTLYALILLALLIYLGTKIDFIFLPIVVTFQTLFFPFLIAGLLFYLFRPIVVLLHQYRIPKALSILLIYLAFIGVVTLAVLLIGPVLQAQFTSLIERTPELIFDIEKQINHLQKNPWVIDIMKQINLEEYTQQASQYISDGLSTIGTNVASLIGVITNIVLAFVTVPFILFYMLKEGEKAPEQVLKLLPTNRRQAGRSILSDMDRAISSFIQGQVTVSFFVGTLALIGYWIIGLDYALLLALVMMFTNVIPYIGPFIGTVPALIVGFIDRPIMALYVLIVAVIAQQLEGNLISPLVMGKTLNVHPLTIIVVLLVSGSLAGFLGLLLAVPTYAVSKVVVSHVYQLWRLRLHSD
ncbi:AI-2E family transporter [Mechercharimyces sp. CAU 1602]|uniref:AI-2E family transporter n=1 Tax=Mechercharimyces sp. CAU 1602 TaxID=2973933 RepID=UPI0021625697|nr:AI-2E family transporter [Mechercharimyces sp. CAU 1602]MCS1351820.1 AI-2E family transporter [Mechercharimyces sp. CAU 1602]